MVVRGSGGDERHPAKGSGPSSALALVVELETRHAAEQLQQRERTDGKWLSTSEELVVPQHQRRWSAKLWYERGCESRNRGRKKATMVRSSAPSTTTPHPADPAAKARTRSSHGSARTAAACVQSPAPSAAPTPSSGHSGSARARAKSPSPVSHAWQVLRVLTCISIMSDGRLRLHLRRAAAETEEKQQRGHEATGRTLARPLA